MSPRTDKITAELLEAGGEPVSNILYKINNMILESGEWPDRWTESILIPLLEKGNTKKCSNNRTVSLINHSSKVLLILC